MKILIIDDDVIDRMAAIRTLKESELSIGQIDQTGFPEEGIAWARDKQYDVILLDYRLPPSNGIEVLRELRGLQGFSAAVVMVSHSNDEELALRCVEAGAQDFLMKGELSGIRLKRSILLASERYELERRISESHLQLRQLAEHDSLTGLRNRYFFDQALQDAIPQARRNGRNLALLLLDLDKFKNINDTLGHVAGDEYLVKVARRLELSIRDGDNLCRLGGDEFAILVHDLERVDQIRLLVKRLFDSLADPVVINGAPVDISVSIGVAVYPECGSDPVELMKSADVAMYRSKELGRNQVQYYSQRFHSAMENRIQLENDLKKSLYLDQLELYYQPLIDGTTGEMSSVEVLVRWNHPVRGLIGPAEFIPIAEETGFINEMGRWVLTKACQQFGRWRQQYGLSRSLTFSIAANLSARQLKDHGLLSHLHYCLEHYQIPPARLELELTESCLENSLVVLDQLTALANLGVNLSLDDFGTGYSSLAHLKDYPFNILKIDRTFVSSIQQESDARLLKAICSFAHSLGYQTVAEGIETELQRDICVSLGVGRMQGFLFSKPLPLSEFEFGWLTSESGSC
ncbi:putative bifunctional diguanylate cyclase/phosphodiesterase [Oceanobacter mangrovi]|uniref:putative bifunctional diguanylate cyclase/phosphodiesterase n=1 Tax=Oceanobacter mangrovi TaxID=2862510 RepID=UPI001C8E12A0|nr:GGDEF domain-containing response regulator [Oceanobacter mangrovi]